MVFSRIQQFFVTRFSRFRWQPSGNTAWLNDKIVTLAIHTMLRKFATLCMFIGCYRHELA